MTAEEYFGGWTRVINLQKAAELRAHLSSLKVPLCPDISNLFRAFHLCRLEDLRLLILAQDPYTDYVKGIPRATGIAFANASDTLEENYSPSLQVLKDSIIDFSIPGINAIFDPTLESIAAQGVLFLNSSLSCIKGNVGSHSLLWRPFTRELLTRLSTTTAGITYLLMGADAQSFQSFINPTGNHILKCSHPAYYARTGTAMPSEIWKEIDDILIRQNGYSIEWYKRI